MIKKILIILFMLSALIASGVYWYCQSLLSQRLSNDEAISWEVKSGQGLIQTLNELEKQNLIINSRHLSVLLRFTQAPNIKQGEYQIAANMGVMDVLALFEAGQSVQYSLTFVEGKTVKEFLVMLAQNDQLKHELTLMSEAEILKAMNSAYLSLEGLIFPDTYFYQKGDSDLDLLKRAYAKLESVLETQWANRAKDLPYKNAYEALIMASIVEKETGAAFERPEIAGVFIRRMQMNMRLQTDPTVIYGLGDMYDGNLTRAHLRADTRYNTYTNKGLPPTPIAASGEEAIFAALNPNDAKALYFVAKGDGTHYFSETLKEHNNAVNEYQRFKRNRKNYQSAPTQ